MNSKTCLVKSCTKQARSRGWCDQHYSRWRRYGDPLLLANRPTPMERFFTKFVQTEEGCWEWLCAKGHFGHGVFGIMVDGKQKMFKAHRLSYEHFVGPIPEGLVIDHLCENPGCVNPKHMEPVTSGENVLRGNGPCAKNARKTKCKRGHSFTKKNTYLNPDGRRICIKCRQARIR